MTIMKAFWIVIYLFLSLLLPFHAAAAPMPQFEVKNIKGEAISLEKEVLRGIKARPLIKIQENWNQKYYPGFISFYKILVTENEEIMGSYKLEEGPARITVYQVSKKDQNAQRFLRVLSTGYFQTGEIAVLHSKIQSQKENVFFITIEKTTSQENLNSHLKYMNTQDNEIILKGYGSNWNLSKLKFKLQGVDPKQRKDNFKKDVGWLINQLINPQRIISIRVKVK